MIRDNRLSFSARGLLVFILSWPSNWQFNMSWLLSETGLGRDKAYSLIKELKALGYCVREQLIIKGKYGKGPFVYTFTDEPGKIDETQLPEKPEAGKTQLPETQDPETQLPEKPDAIQRNIDTTKEKEETNTQSARARESVSDDDLKGKEGDLLVSKEAREEARRVCAGWDIDHLVDEWRKWSNSRDEIIRNVDAAFLAFCRRKGPHRDAKRKSWTGTGAQIPDELKARDGEITISNLSAEWSRWMAFTEHRDRVLADRMRGARFAFVPTRNPKSDSPLPRLPEQPNDRSRGIGLQAPRRAGPFLLKPKDPEFSEWIEHLKATDRDDLVCEARDAGQMTVPTRRPPGSEATP